MFWESNKSQVESLAYNYAGWRRSIVRDIIMLLIDELKNET